MKNRLLLVCTLFVSTIFLGGCTKSDEDETTLTNSEEESATGVDTPPMSDMRIAFLGGSQCMHGFKSTSSFQSESFPLKDKVMERFGLKEGNLEVVAMEGAGAARPEFSNSGTMNLCRQALMLTQRKACDVYVIWLQSNDYTGSGNMMYPAAIGNVTDGPSSEDVRNDRETFYGGLNYSINTLRAKNPQARILLISPTRCILHYYLEGDRGYLVGERTEGGEETLYIYVKAFHDYADYHHLPFLDLFVDTDFNLGGKVHEEARAIWLQHHTDGTHLNAAGYAVLADKIVNFIAGE